MKKRLRNTFYSLVARLFIKELMICYMAYAEVFRSFPDEQLIIAGKRSLV